MTDEVKPTHAAAGGDKELLRECDFHDRKKTPCAPFHGCQCGLIVRLGQRLRQRGEELVALLDAAEEYQTATENLRMVGTAACENLQRAAHAELYHLIANLRSAKDGAP